MKKFQIIIITVFAFLSQACSEFLDIVPDNLPTVDMAFNMRTTAEKYLFTCYSYLPTHGSLGGNMANAAGDEFWFPEKNIPTANNIARGKQRVTDPYMNYWQGANGGRDLFEGIRQCNVFLEKIDRVPDMTDTEKDRWKAEVKFLKAYYHFYLLRIYGPIPLIKENVPVDASYGDVYPTREPVDVCFDYIVSLLDDAIQNGLPETIDLEVNEMGRITQEIALAQKAIILVEAASKLYNGNSDYAGFKNIRGEELFNRTESKEKWEKAALACQEAINFSHQHGRKLYHFVPGFTQTNLSDTIKTQMSIRNSVCEKWNSEIIWGSTNSRAGSIQNASTPRGLDPAFTANNKTEGYFAPTLKIVEMFYTANGLPIDEDLDYEYGRRWEVDVVPEKEMLYLKDGHSTSLLNFHREPRFYADLGFDGSIWYGQGRFDDKAGNLFYVSSRKGQPAAAQNEQAFSVTGYWPKKLVNYNNVISADAYNVTQYPWPEIRLSNLYLLYAEALNEAYGPSLDICENWIDPIRVRAGLKGVQETWDSPYSKKTGKYTTYQGLKEIIHRERLIELAFEGQRYWDIRRWKEATTEFNKPVVGWDVNQEEPLSYYRQKILYNQQFRTRDYFNPIPETELLSNKNLGQFPGW